MKAAQIIRYSKDIHVMVNDIPVPEIGDYDILIRVKAAAVNPVDILNLTGAIPACRSAGSGLLRNMRPFPKARQQGFRRAPTL